MAPVSEACIMGLSLLPAEVVEDILEVSTVFVVVGVVQDVVIITVCRVVDVLILRYHSDVVNSNSYSQTGVANPAEIQRLRRVRDVVIGGQTVGLQKIVHQNVR